MSLPTDPVDLFVLGAFVVLMPFIAYRVFRDTFSAYLPAERAKVPKVGKLEKLLSPELKSFVASLPRPAGDPLAHVFTPLSRETLPYWDDHHGYVSALYPLWRIGGRNALAVRAWSKSVKEHTEFVLSGDEARQWDMRAYSEQGFFADTIIDLLESNGPAGEAARALGFRYLDETRAWHLRFRATDWTKPVHDEDDEDQDEDDDSTPEERKRIERFSFVREIDKREKK